MWQLKWIVYITLAIIGGGILEKILPGSSALPNTGYLLIANILYELLDWKYNSKYYEGEENE